VIHVVDTHALLWYLEGSNKLSRTAHQVLAETSDPLILPIIVLSEARYAISKQRTTLTWQHLLKEVERDNRFTVRHLDLDIVRRASEILEMHDALICATALVHREASGESVPLITKDRRIRDSGLVETVW
jgi:PIN domain nuclease of toxin-antitoxin system